MAEKLSIQIALEGGAEIERQLADIGDAGQKAFADITKAADKAGGFRQLDPKDVTGKLKELGVTGADSINKIQAAVKSAGRLEGLAANIASVEKGFDELGKTVSKTTTRMASAFGVLAPAVRALGAPGLALGALGAAFTKFAVDASAGAKDLQRLADVSGKSVSDLTALQGAFSAAGISTKDFTTSLGALYDKLNEVGPALREQLAGSADAAAAALDRVASARLALQRAQIQRSVDRGDIGQAEAAEELLRLRKQENDLAVSDARRRVTEAENAALKEQANNLGRNVTLIQQAIAAGQQIRFPDLTTGASKMNAFLAVLDQVRQRGGDVIPVLGSMLRGMTAVDAIDFGKNIGLSPEIVEGFRSGAINAEGLAAAMRKSKEEAETSARVMKTFDEALRQLNATWERVKASLGTGFAATTIGEFNRIISAIGWLEEKLGGLASGDLMGRLATALGAPAVGEAIARIAGGLGMMAVEVGKFAAALLGISWDAVASAGVAAWDAITGAIGRAIDKLLKFVGVRQEAAAPAAGGGGGGLPMAGGGMMGGRGTGTSDSNLAWLSRGEHVMPARAVRQPGVLAFLEALRRSGGNLSRVLDGMGRFAMGGMVAPRLAGIPAFAKGGLNGGGSRTLNLTIGAETFRGLSVPEHTAQSLERFAVHSQIASTGRKPSWKR